MRRLHENSTRCTFYHLKVHIFIILNGTRGNWNRFLDAIQYILYTVRAIGSIGERNVRLKSMFDRLSQIAIVRFQIVNLYVEF